MPHTFRNIVSSAALPKAKTLHDILKATYDALESHRVQLAHQSVAPMWGSTIWRYINEDTAKTVQGLLTGERGTIRDHFPTCLAIDFDNALRLDSEGRRPRELMQRTGIPLYTAGSVCKGRVLGDISSRIFSRMPELSEKAQELYIRAHGRARYDRYNDTGLTVHGAPPPSRGDFDKPRAFCRRPGHDVESIYWTMVLTLLRVRPTNIGGEPETSKVFAETWMLLLLHRIPDADEGYIDLLLTLLLRTREDWPSLFLGDMKSMGPLLSDVSMQVLPEYAVCGDGLLPDHLHEAVQRLILQYLVDHDDIVLVPGRLRPIPRHQRITIPRSSKQATAQGSGVGSGSRSLREAKGSTCRASKNKAASSSTKYKSASVTRDTAAQSGCSTGSSTSRASVAAIPNAIVIDPKRKSSSQTGRGPKRLRTNSDPPQSMERVWSDA